MLSNACVVEDLGIHPNWFSLIIFITAGRTCSSTTNSSATLDSTGVNDTGRKSLLISWTNLCFGIGVMSAVFHDGGEASLSERTVNDI